MSAGGDLRNALNRLTDELMRFEAAFTALRAIVLTALILFLTLAGVEALR